MLSLAVGLAPHLLGYGWDRFLGRRLSRDLVAGSVEELTPDLLASVLGGPAGGLRIGGVEVLDQHSGTTARARLALRDVTGPAADRVPETIFAKLAPVDLPTRLFGNLMNLGRNEVDFYRDLRGGLPIDTPEVHAALTAGTGGRFLLLLEDLGADPDVTFRAGRPLSGAEARPVVEALARMQAALWQSPRFDSELAWLKRPGHNPNRRVERSVSKLSTAPCLRRFGDLMSEPVQRAAHLLYEERDRLEALWGRGELTLAHGDPHLGNFYFRAGRPGFFDWQVCQVAQGTRDLTYFLITSVDRERLPDCERELIGVYRDTLRKHGVDPLPLEDLWHEYRLHALYVLIAVVVTAASSTMQSESVARAGIENISRTLTRIDSLGAFENSR